ncbi:hypothetical protein A0J61_10794 [Choanephora cucurbitarum]|uniref:Peptidase A2 domain-containing protein n=1 Tax=Choanephora cucurbitarum TaxID=101091 RepID=A0A1C7MWJ8_9FUNG|nr:hypothetical protein A0J61_10794 [Choanephora cucurbitarum]
MSFEESHTTTLDPVQNLSVSITTKPIIKMPANDSEQAISIPVGRLTTSFEPGKHNLNFWLQTYEASCKRYRMSNYQMLVHVTDYLLERVRNWILNEPNLTHWAKVKAEPLQAFGMPPKEHRLLLMKQMQALRQNKTASREFRIYFQTAINKFPEDLRPDGDDLRAIYLMVMSPKLKDLIAPNAHKLTTWKEINETADALELSLYMDPANSLACEFERLTLQASEEPSTTPATVVRDDPMQVDAIRQKQAHDQSFAQRKQDPMRRWTADHQPICSHCNKDPQTSVNAMSQRSQVTYAAVPIENDPLSRNQPTVNNIGLSRTSSLVISTKIRTPMVTITLHRHLVKALLDTGADISVIRNLLAEKLGLTPDPSKATTFTIADNSDTSSRGNASVVTMVGSVQRTLLFHVADQLNHPVILEYPELHELGAIIDTGKHEVWFPPSTPGAEPPASMAVCFFVSSLRFPSQHHAFADICDPPNSAVIVSIPAELTAKKLLSVASGFVNFDNKGIATAKLANLNNNDKILNIDQIVAYY